MKIGIIYTAFNTEKYLVDSLASWFDAKGKNLDDNEFCIVAVSVPFEKFNEPITDKTQDVLAGYQNSALIDWTITSDTPKKETDARGAALTYLKSVDCDIVWQVDSDEFYTTEQISKILKFIRSQQFICSFRLSLKNYVFSEDSYLEEPFTPMRIHRLNPTNYTVAGFWDDNNVYYVPPEASSAAGNPKDVEMSTMTVPKSVAWIKHLTWLSDERSKKKVAYQTARGWQCSFKWNDATNSLEFNNDYYRARGILPPKLIRS